MGRAELVTHLMRKVVNVKSVVRPACTGRTFGLLAVDTRDAELGHTRTGRKHMAEVVIANTNDPVNYKLIGVDVTVVVGKRIAVLISARRDAHIGRAVSP